MSRSLGTSLAVLACAGIAAGAAAADTSGANPTVKPRVGKPGTNFVVSFRAPQSTGQIGSSRVSYEVSAGKRSPSSGCTWWISSSVTQATAGSMVYVKLSPQGAGRRWCRGIFHGQIQEFIAPVCGCPGPVGAQIMCPLRVAAVPCLARAAILPVPQTIGTFSFRVRRHPHHMR
jgi:hypothetical protein